MSRERAEPAGAWRALVACVLTILVVAGARFSLAAFLRPIEADLGLNRLTLSVAGALTQIGYGLALPIVGLLAARVGARRIMMASVALMGIAGLGAATASQAWQILLFTGLLPGLGFGGSTVVPATAFLALWFRRRLGLATGLMSSAIPAGQSLFVPLAIGLIPLLGWRAAYLLLGLGQAAVALPALGWLARDAPGTTVSTPLASRPRARADLDIWLVGAGYFACGFTDQFVSLHLVALATEAGVEPLVAGGLFSLLMVAGVAGSILSGPLADAASPRLMLGGLYLLRAATLPFLLLAGPGLGEWTLGLFGLLFGLTYIANQAPGTRLVRDRYGTLAVGPLMGSVGFAHQIGGALGIAAGGASVALSGNYSLAVLTAAAVALFGALLQAFIRPAAAPGTPRSPA